jgi:perosamine synthetase
VSVYLEQPLTPAADPDPIATLEGELAAFLGGSRAVVACEGAASAFEIALHVALEGEDASIEVAVPAIGASLVARAAVALGHPVVPVEVEQDSATIASRGLATAVGPRTRAVVIAHTAGHPASMADLLRLAQHHDLAVIEDARDALGASYGGIPVGTLAPLAILGGGPGHLLSREDFGAVVCGSDELASRARAIRAERDAALDDDAARVTLAELRQVPERLHARAQAAWHLSYELRGVRGVRAMPHARRIQHGYDVYLVRFASLQWPWSIEETVGRLLERGVQASVAVERPLHEDGDVRSALGDEDPRLAPSALAIASRLSEELVSIPLAGHMSTRDMDDVAAVIRALAAEAETARSEAR